MQLSIPAGFACGAYEPLETTESFSDTSMIAEYLVRYL